MKYINKNEKEERRRDEEGTHKKVLEMWQVCRKDINLISDKMVLILEREKESARRGGGRREWEILTFQYRAWVCTLRLSNKKVTMNSILKMQKLVSLLLHSLQNDFFPFSIYKSAGNFPIMNTVNFLVIK